MPHQELYNKMFAAKIGNSNPKEMLQNICNDYPYFSLAHFFLLKESSPTDFNYRKIAGKTALHFNNPFMLKYQLNRKLRNEVEEVLEVQEVPEITKVTDVNEEPVALEILNTADFEEVEKANEIKNEAKLEKAEVNMEKVEQANISEKEAIIQKPAEKETLLFEPLHTTDYFASQGIKLSEEVQTGDKLGKQLKSFTDWLKTMKKVHHGKLPEGNPNVDITVQKLAEKSNKEEDILTESMAEVFSQQGKKEKAIEVYKKLSLLNPAKSAYFAAKIEFLKEN